MQSISSLVQQGREWEYLQSLALAQQVIHSEAQLSRTSSHPSHLHKRLANEPAEKLVDHLLQKESSLKKDLLPTCPTEKSPPVKQFNTSHPEQYDESRTFALYAAAAYCQPARLRTWQCGSRCVGGENKAGPTHTRVLLYFRSRGISDTTGYMALEENNVKTTSQPHQKPRLIIAFQGSLSVHHWINNLRMFPVPYPARDQTWKSNLSQCKESETGNFTCQPQVHQGFLAGYMEVAETIRNMTFSMMKLYPELDIFCTGHSLGGALAVLAAVDLHDYLSQLGPKKSAGAVSMPLVTSRKRFSNAPPRAISMGALKATSEHLSYAPKKIVVYTFGQPRIGNRAFADYVRSRSSISIFRINYHTDPVPHLPPRILGYRHHQNEVWITSKGEALQCAAAADQPLSLAMRNPVPEISLPLNSTDDALECSEDESESSRCAHSLHLIQLNILSHVRIWDVFFGPFC